MYFCPECGTSKPSETAKFCGSCGSLNGETTSTSNAPLPDTNTSATVSDVDPRFYDLLAPSHDYCRDWAAAVSSVIADYAQEWLNASVPTSRLLADINPDLQRDLAREGGWMTGVTLSPGLVIFPFDQPTGSDMNPRSDNLLTLSSATHTSRVLKALAEAEINMVPLGDDSALIGWWPTSAGGFAVQLASIYRSSTGREYLYFYSSPLTSVGGVYAENDAAFVSLTVAIPAILQSVVYLAECPTPLSPGPLHVIGGRGPILFGVPDESTLAPIPVARLALAEHPRGMNVYACTDDRGMTRTYFCSGRIDVGWVISLEGSDSLLDRGIRVAVTGGQRMANILEDGGVSQNSKMEFQTVLMSQSTTVPGSGQVWIPTSSARYFMKDLEVCR